MIPTLAWTPEGVRFIDQTRLPLEESYVLATTYEQVADVIVAMIVRGAPAIGVSAAYGVALGALRASAGAGLAIRTLAGAPPLPAAALWLWAHAALSDAPTVPELVLPTISTCGFGSFR